jgi:hypothetical protein
MVPVLIMVNRASEDVLKLFLDMPQRAVQRMFSQSEMFVQELRNSDDDDLQGANSEFGNDHGDTGGQDGEEKGIIKLRKRKKFVNAVENNTNIIFAKLGLAMIVVEAYFLYNYLSNEAILTHTNTLLQELNTTAVC